MLHKKDFWIAVFMFAFAIFFLTDLIRNGFATYRISGLILLPFLGIAFLRRALK